MDTPVEASFNTTFSISAIRLKVVFMDGTERDVDANSNITLRVEVTAPTSNYTLEWACRLADSPDSSCFTEPDPWDTFTATRRVADRLVVRLWHMWDILHDDGDDGSRGVHPSSVTTTTYTGEDNTLRYKASPSENSLPRAAARASTASPLSKRTHTAKIPLFQRSSVKYIQTISFPASSLLHGEDKFIVSVSCRYHHMASSDQQLIVIKSPRDSVGILSYLRTQFPFGAARRIVFESECMSCSPEELSSLRYSWHLKMIYEGTELEATTRAREGKVDSKDMALHEAIRQGRSENGFLPRPRDYLRVYNMTFAQAPLYQAVQREDDEDSPLSYTQYFNARDLQKLEGLVTPDMAARALEMERSWKEALQSSHKREKGQTGTHTFGRLKHSVQSPPLQRGWGRGGEKNTGGSGRASPSTHHHGDAQHHQMKDHHRISSTQTNKRRGVVGRQLSLWRRGEDWAHDTTSLDPLPITSAEVVPRSDWAARKEEVPDLSWNAIKGTNAMAHRNMERKDSRKLQQVDAGSLPPPLHPHAERVNSGNSGRKFQTQEGMFSARQNVADKDTRLAYADGGGRGTSRSNERLQQLQAAGKVQDILELHSHEMIPRGGRANDFERKEVHKEEKDVERVSEGNRGEMLRQMNEGNHVGRDDQPGGGSEKRKKWRQMIVSGGGRGEAQARVTTEDPDEGVSFASTLTNSQVTERGDSGPDKESREDLRRAGVTQVTVEVGGGSPAIAVTPLNPPSEQPANARLIHQSGGEDAERAGGTTSAAWSTDAAAGAPHSSPSRPPALPQSLARPTPVPPSETSPSITPSLQVDKEQEERLSPASDDHSAREDEWLGLSALHQSRLEPEQEEKEDTKQSEKIILETEDKPVLMKSQARKRWINRRGKKDKGRLERPKLEATLNKKKLEERDKEQQTENRWPVTTLSHEEEEAGYKENHLTFGADVNGGEREAVEESDTEEEKSEVGAGRLKRINRQSTHQRHDSAHMPIRVAPSKGAPIRQSDQFVHGGVKKAAGATERKASMQRVLPVLLPDQSGVLDYHKYRKDIAAQLSSRQTSPNSSSESDLKGGRNVEDRLKQASSSEGHPRSGGDEIASNLTTGDGIVVSHIPVDAGARSGLPSRLASEREDQFPQRQKGSSNRDADKVKQESRGWWNTTRGAGGEVGRSPPSASSTSRPRPPTIAEGQVESIRGVGNDYQKAVNNYATTYQEVPNLSCRPERWKECSSAQPRGHIDHVLNQTIGTLGGGESRMPTNFMSGPFLIENERAQIDVHFFWELTSTGTHEPVLVLYTDYLKTKARYLLYLDTYNSITNNSGLATQLIEFSPPPSVENCRITPLPDKNGAWFRGSCDEVHGHYNPVLLQWSYSFVSLDTGAVLSQGLGTKVVFYHGARPSIDFPLPSGLESKDYNVHVSIKAIDGKGVSYKYPPVMNLIIYPRCNTGDGILSLFQEIPTIENESPSLLLQQVRTLAWELNVMKYCDITQTIFDNILTILFYKTSCKDILQIANASPYNSEYSSQNSIDFFVKVNLLKSCARDHLTKIVADLPVRDEMEVVQVLTALQNLVDNDELISSKTYSRVIISMHTVARRMLYTYNPEVKAEAVEQYFVLSSAVLDKQSDIYDGNTTSVQMSNTVISLILDVMGGETKTRFLEEQPLVFFTETLKYQGFLAETNNINRWNHSLSFIFEPNSVPDGVHLVQSLEHKQSPYNITKDPVTSEVVNIDLHMPSNFLRQVKVKVKRSVLRNGNGYNFQLSGLLTAQFLSVYEFMVNKEHDNFALHILLHITEVLNPDYPVAAILLICNDMQSLKEPIYKQEVMAANEPSQVSLFIPPAQLPYGKLLLIIMDKNSYTNNRARYNSSDTGANFLVSGWWSQCLVWGNTHWHHQNCSVIGEESSWDYTTCSCKSHFSVYGAQSIPILGDESKVEVNELMLHETYLALYFMLLLLLVYFILALALQTSDRHRLRRRNIWLRDNKPDHEYAYLLTIKTGTQWNAGTTARVYAILHGTHGMSETRELQSQQTGQLFTRGALCTFILTTAEQLGDILKVQVWHDNSGGSESGWYVCETSVADLVHGARYAYPCYRWLSVQAEDAKIEREITLESPTTFLLDFEHFLPQYASEHMLWTSLLTTSSTAKLYRLQRVTICLIVCLCMGTVSLSVVQKINSDHTMMVPDMHIESLYYGAFIAMLLLPVQWLLEMVFKMSNRLEEKEYNAKTVLDTLRATKEMVGTQTANDMHENCQEEIDKENGDIYDINAKMWRNLTDWAQDIDLPDLKSDVLHPALLQREDNTQITQRSRKNTGTEARNNSLAAPPSAAPPTNLPNLVNDDHGTANAKKCSPIILNFFSELRKTFNYIVYFVAKNERGKMKKRATFEEEGWGLEEDKDDDDDMESDELRVTSSITFIFSQCFGWIVCCLFAAMCCMVLFVRGSGMPMDYGSLWIHIMYITLCCSVFIMQPLVVVIYTLYKVCMYRWLGCRGCISSCVTVPLEQVVAIWNRYQTVLLEQVCTAKIMDREKLLEERQRTRYLRYAHPPSEDYLLKCREKELRKGRVSSLFCSTTGHLLFLILLIIIASSVNVKESYRLNRAIFSALENGTCQESASYLDTCKNTGTDKNSCNQAEDINYMRFKDIKNKNDWWKWANSELLALTYNSDQTFSIYNNFCDLNSVIIGTPRIRKYDIGSEECQASKVKIDNNRSMADLLRVKTCFPDYVDQVAHLFSFGSNIDRGYKWDAHFLAVTYGQFGHYSYTAYQKVLPSSRLSSILTFIVLQSTNWIDENKTRAVVTDFTLYHPQTRLYTTIALLAEFPSLSGVKLTTNVWSTHIERYNGRLSAASMMAEILLLAVAMRYLYQTTIYIYTCRFRIWKSFWGILDILMTVVSWSYVVCLMLRVQIAEDALWQLRVAYFQKFVNLKSLATWDEILEAMIGVMMMLHILHCLCLMQYLPRLRCLLVMVASAAKDVFIISIVMGVLVIACSMLGHMWFSHVMWECHTLPQTALTLFGIMWAHFPFMKKMEYESSGYTTLLGYLYYLITYVFLYQVGRSLYIAAFLNVRKSHVNNPGLDVKWEDISYYVKQRSQSVLQKVFLKKDDDDESQPKDNTPPDFYMTELDLQISQVMAGLEDLAETLGLVVKRMDRLLDEDQSTDFDMYNSDGVSKDTRDDAAWQPEIGFNMFRPFQSSLEEAQEDADGSKQLQFSNVITSRKERLENTKLEDRSRNSTPHETSFNLDAFTDIASCHTEIEALARNWNLNSTTFEQRRYGTEDDGGRLAKFLKDVSAASDESVTSFGKYGKTVSKLKVNPKLHPSHESLTAVQNLYCISTASDTTRTHHLQSLVTSHQQQNPVQSNHIDMPAQSPLGVSSRLCRTQTQGRGKGHVDVLDIISLESDSDSET